jgi:3-phenylpropionate/cinnamic acid dioxygenase small subunit
VTARDVTAVRNELENLLYRYAELADARDAEGLSRLLADATVEFPGSGTLRGAGRIGEHYREVFDGTPPSRHVVTNVIVSAAGADTASTRCRYARWLLGTSADLVALGEYQSGFRRDNGGWRFDRHVVTRSWSA